MPDIIRCQLCKKPIIKNSHGLCPLCREVEQEMLKKVRSFLNTHPHSSIDVVVKETEVPYEFVEKFIDSGVITAYSKENLTCEKCGKKVNKLNRAGKPLCSSCSQNISHKIEKDLSKNEFDTQLNALLHPHKPDHDDKFFAKN